MMHLKLHEAQDAFEVKFMEKRNFQQLGEFLKLGVPSWATLVIYYLVYDV
jgi:hypothetical protein